MAPIKLHGDYRSQPTRAVGAFLMLNKDKIDYEFVLQSFERTPEEVAKYTKEVNPFGRIPALEFCPFMISSNACLQYLAEIDGVPEHWYPRSGKGKILVNQYLSWHGPDMRHNATGILMAYFIEPFFMKKPCPEDKLKEAQAGFEKMMNQLENYWLKDSAYIAGEDISIADLQCISELANVEQTDIDLYKDRPKVAAYTKRVKERMGPVHDALFKDGMDEFSNQFKMYQESKK